MLNGPTLITESYAVAEMARTEKQIITLSKQLENDEDCWRTPYDLSYEGEEVEARLTAAERTYEALDRCMTQENFEDVSR